MPYDLAAAEELSGKKAVITYNLETPNAQGETAVEVEGTILGAAEMGVMFRPRGNQQPVMVHNHQIEEIRGVNVTKRDIAQKLLKAITLDDARAHLADRHAFPLATVNAMTAGEAFNTHLTIDHEPLGHAHRDDED